MILYFDPRREDGASTTRLWIECAWRLKSNRKIQIGAIDDPEDVVKTLQSVIGVKLETLSIDDASGDLCLQFSKGVSLESFGFYPAAGKQWELRCCDGLRMGIGPEFTPFERT